MPPTDPRTAELVAVTREVVVGMIVAHERRDDAEMLAQIGRLLNAVCRFSNTRPERASDAALVRAIERLRTAG